jgi:hypothetical protein
MTIWIYLYYYIQTDRDYSQYRIVPNKVLMPYTIHFFRFNEQAGAIIACKDLFIDPIQIIILPSAMNILLLTGYHIKHNVMRNYMYTVICNAVSISEFSTQRVYFLSNFLLSYGNKTKRDSSQLFLQHDLSIRI